jgi:hypothetical protein
MSRKIGLDTIYLRPTPRIGHTDYCSNDALKRHLGVSSSVLGPAEQQFGTKQAAVESSQRFEDVWEMDLIWITHDGPGNWADRGRTTDMGHGDFLEGGTDRRSAKPAPFKDVEEIWAFDAEKEYGIPNSAELVPFFEDYYRKGQADFPDQIYTGGYYKTMVSGAIEAFGWDLLLEAAADQAKFERVLDSFFRLAMHYFKAWAKTSIDVFICHDDMVWSQGPFMHPDFYRRVIFPRYKALWSVLRQAGKKILYCSDGNFTMFADDVAAAGADGFIFESLTSLDTIVGKFGRTHVIVGSKLDCRTLTFGTRAQIQADVDATLKLARDCPGFMFAVGNHIPSNVPVDNALFYFDYLKKHWAR